MAGSRGLKGADRTPRQDPRVRRNAQRFAGDAGFMFSGALAVDDEGLIVLNLVTNGGLSQSTAGLTVVVTAPIALDAGGVHLDYTTGLTLDGTDLVLDILGLTEDTIAAGDWVPFHDLADAPNKITFANFEGTLNHDALTNFVALEHIDWTGATQNFETSGTLKVGTVPNYAEIKSDGDLIFHGTAGLPYGSCYGNEIAWSQAAAVQDNWYLISIAGMADGQLHYVTHDGDGQLTVTLAGKYLISWAWAGGSSVNNDHVQIGISVDGGDPSGAGLNHFETNKANSHDVASGTAILSLAADQTIEVAIRTTDNNTPTLDTDHINLTAVMVGG